MTQAAEGRAVETWAVLGFSATDPNKLCSTRSSSGITRLFPTTWPSPASNSPPMCGRHSMATCNAAGWSTDSCVFTRDGVAQGLLASGKPPHRSRLRCDTCHAEHLLAFSCKRRGFCPSCGARRMADGAAWLVDQVLPERPIRQRRRERPHVLREAQAVRERSRRAWVLVSRFRYGFFWPPTRHSWVACWVSSIG